MYRRRPLLPCIKVSQTRIGDSLYDEAERMMAYVIILLAVACFAAQCAFTKLYESVAGQAATASVVMLVGTAVWAH